MPIERAEPASVRMAASTLAAFMSFSLVLASIDVPGPHGNNLRIIAPPCCYPIRLKKQEMSQQLGTGVDFGEGYGQIAAWVS